MLIYYSLGMNDCTHRSVSLLWQDIFVVRRSPSCIADWFGLESYLNARPWPWPSNAKAIVWPLSMPKANAMVVAKSTAKSFSSCIFRLHECVFVQIQLQNYQFIMRYLYFFV